MRKTLTLAIALTLATTIVAAPVSAAMVAIIDYVGFGVEDGGFPSSDPGDVLEVFAVATFVGPEFGLDLSSEEVTVHITGLTSTGEFTDPISGFTLIGYTGGFITVYSDPAQNAQWEPFPGTGFDDGSVVLSGAFTDFTMAFNTAGAGAFEGNIDGIGGTVAELCNDCEYTFGGAFTNGSGVQIPPGYDMQIDGTLEVDSAVKTTQSSFGKVKALYNAN